MEALDASFKLQDRTVLMTGPMTTLNQTIAMRFTQLGANIALVDRNIDRSERFAAQIMDAREINERFGRAFAIQSDLSKPHHVQDAISRAAEVFGGLDIYVDALITTEVKSFRDPQALDDLDRQIDTNLRAPLLMTHGILRYLEGRKRGRVIYLLHDLARLGLPQNSLMAATRSGLMAYSKTLAREVAEFNVTVNCVALGVTEDFLLAQHGGQTSIQQAQTELLKQFPFAQMVDSERMANVVAFLASPLGAGITGQVIAASQGLT